MVNCVQRKSGNMFFLSFILVHTKLEVNRSQTNEIVENYQLVLYTQRGM